MIYAKGGKRAFDLVVAGGLLLLLSPVLLLLAAVVRGVLGAPVLFRQRRAGRGGAPFRIVKFRSMADRRDPEGRPLPDAERLGRFGCFLRSSSLDELPELWNVLRGEMSLVGPRPLLPEYGDRYSRRQARRLEVRPGITGWAQVNGRNALDWERRFELDVWYVDHLSFPLDLKILLRTAWKTLRREGIAAEGSATMEEFRGSPPAPPAESAPAARSPRAKTANDR